MIDEIYDRDYQAGREQLSAAITAAFKRGSQAIDNAFRVLNRIEYQAPWTGKPKHARSH